MMFLLVSLHQEVMAQRALDSRQYSLTGWG